VAAMTFDESSNDDTNVGIAIIANAVSMILITVAWFHNAAMGIRAR